MSAALVVIAMGLALAAQDAPPLAPQAPVPPPDPIDAPDAPALPALAEADATDPPPRRVIGAEADDAPDAPPETQRGPAPASKPGWLTVRGSEGASVFVDGVRVGVVPLTRHAIAPGRHNVDTVLAGHAARRTPVKVTAGDVAVVDATLSPVVAQDKRGAAQQDAYLQLAPACGAVCLGLSVLGYILPFCG